MNKMNKMNVFCVSFFVPLGLCLYQQTKQIDELSTTIKTLESKSPPKKILKDDVCSKTLLSVTKKIMTTFDSDQINVYENEKKWLTRLKDSPYIAKPIHFDDANRIITTEYAGEKINAHNLPANWEEQRDAILGELKSYHCRHNDIKPDEILVHEGKLKIIDFGWAHDANTTNPDYWPAGLGDKFRCNKPDQKFDDECSFNKSVQHIRSKGNLVKGT